MTDFLYIIYDAANIPTCGNNETEIYGPQWGYSAEGMSANNLAGPIFMKKQMILEECNWILTDEAKNDTNLNPTDKNVLAILQYMFDNKTPFDDGYYSIVLREKRNIEYTLQGTLDELGVKLNQSTIGLTINKLSRLGYIDYRRGFYNNKTNSGQPAKIKILKGTTSLTDSISVSYNDITHRTKDTPMCNNQITDCNSDTCSDIAHRKNIEIEKVQVEVQVKGTYSYSDLGLEKIDSNESDIWRVEDTTFVGDSDKSIDLKSYLDDNVCNGNVMGDLLEWAIDNGWFTCNTQVDRVIDATRENCSLVALNADHYKKLFKRYEEKAERERLAKIIHA